MNVSCATSSASAGSRSMVSARPYTRAWNRRTKTAAASGSPAPIAASTVSSESPSMRSIVVPAAAASARRGIALPTAGHDDVPREGAAVELVLEPVARDLAGRVLGEAVQRLAVHRHLAIAARPADHAELRDAVRGGRRPGARVERQPERRAAVRAT